MHNLSRTFSLEEAKIQAQILLKQMYSQDLNQANQAKIRLQGVEELANINPDRIQLKHALAIIAAEYGFNSWVNLKKYFTVTSLTKFETTGGFINQWFSSYKEAKQILKESGGYLLPYKNQFFICEFGYIEFIKLDAYSSEWQAINYNWIEPNDIAAWEHLNKMYTQAKKVDLT